MKPASPRSSMARRSTDWSVQDGPESAFYVNDGAIVVHESAGYPAWLRSARQYENFDFRGEFFVKGWINSGIYLHAPEHGRNMWCGMKINIFHQVDAEARARIDGLDLSARAAAQSQRQKPGRVELLPHPDGLAAPARVDQRRAGPGSRRRDRARTAPPPAQRLSRLRVALLSHPLPQSARPRTAVESRVDAALRNAAGLRQVARLRRQAAVRSRSARVLHGDGLGHFATVGKVPRFRAADVRAPRLASQRRRPLPHLRAGLARPPLRDPAPRRRRRALSHRLAVYHQARPLPAHRGRRNGGSSNCASKTPPAWSASTARPSWNTTAWTISTKVPSNCRRTMPAAGPSTSRFSSVASDAAPRSTHGKHPRNPRASRRRGVPGRRHHGPAGRPRPRAHHRHVYTGRLRLQANGPRRNRRRAPAGSRPCRRPHRRALLLPGNARPCHFR